MAKQIKISIPVPCHENWGNMSPVEKGKFCGSCQKEVIDFSTMSDRQVAEFFKKPTTGSVCGRFMNDQLYRDITIPKKRIPWIKYFFQFLLPVFLITQKGFAQKKGKVKVQTVLAKDLEACRPTMGIIAMPTEEKVDTTVTKVIPTRKELNNILDRTLMGDTILRPLKNLPEEPFIGRLGGIVIISEQTIIGRVVDENGKPVAFASIMVKGTRKGALTDKDGVFTIRGIKERRPALIASAVGFETKEYDREAVIYNELITLVLTERKEYFLGEISFINSNADNSIDTTKSIDSTLSRNLPLKVTQENSIYINIYPNPVLAGTRLTIEFENIVVGSYKLQLLDVAGKLYQAEDLTVGSGKWIHELNLPSIPGTYFLSILNSATNSMTTKKVIVR